MTVQTKIVTAEELMNMPDDGTRRELVRGELSYWPGAPDLMVEVVSPNDRYTEVMDKALIWLEAGCLMVLVADPGRRTVTVYRSREEIRVLTAKAGDIVDGTEVVPAWELPVVEIFA